MTHDITITEVDEVQVVAVRLTAPPSDIGAEVGCAYQHIYACIDRTGIAPTGPPRLVYHKMDDDAWTVEACVPICQTSRSPDGPTVHRFTGGPAATTLHVGPYDRLGDAYQELEAWVGKHDDLEPAGAPFGVYLNSPGEVRDPAKLRTEIFWPVRRTTES